MLQDAVIWNLDLIDEACAHLSEDLPRANPGIRLAPGYFDVNLRLVLRTARESLPPFARQVKALIGA
jgi:uncharacterized protein with HEPN domain